MSAPTSNPKVITGGVEIHKCTQEFIWKIRNWAYVQKDKALFEKQLFRFEMGKSPEWSSKWVMGLRQGLGNYPSVDLYLKLLQVSGFDLIVYVEVTVPWEPNQVFDEPNNIPQYHLNGDQNDGGRILREEFEGFKQLPPKLQGFLKPDEEICQKPYGNGRRLIDENGSLVQPIKIEVVHFVHVKEPDTTNNLLTR